jgi:hypothetical protein
VNNWTAKTDTFAACAIGRPGRSQRMIVPFPLTLLILPIAPSISTLFWTAFLSLLILVFISFTKKFTMVSDFKSQCNSFSLNELNHPLIFIVIISVILDSHGTPGKMATSESLLGSLELRMYRCPALLSLSYRTCIRKSEQISL